MAHRKLNKEVEAIFKKINEGVDLFDYYYSRHQSSNNESQREKLESDLKKEIKKLQKFREQIKSWQSNEAVETVIASNKLQEHRRMVEEAMETFKEVEKSSKMKSFSNQSIMLAALERSGGLGAGGLEAMEFLEGAMEALNDQNSELEEEYERLSEKKSKKVNHATEERKQEIDALKEMNNFHLSNLASVSDFLKHRRLTPDVVLAIQDDVNFYIESNQEPDFVNDDTLYDELFSQVSETPMDFNGTEEPEAGIFADGHFDPDASQVSNSNDDRSTPPTSAPPTANGNPSKPSTGTTSAPPSAHSNKGPTETNDSTSGSVATTPVKKTTPEVQAKSVSQIASRGDASSAEVSPAVAKILKLAVVPPAPVGTIKWSVAAAAGAGLTDTPVTESANSTSSNIKEASKPEADNSWSSAALQDYSRPQIESSDSYYPYLQVLENSEISSTEKYLFTDLNMLKVPPGIQDLIISFNSSRDKSDESKLLTHEYERYSTPIFKTYLPQEAQKLEKPPLQLMKLQSYWNRIRANNQFNQFFEEVQHLTLSNNPENNPVINELMMVLFYGYYYALTPLENIIAESYLFKLNWKPYGIKLPSKDGAQEDLEGQNKAKYSESFQHYYWLNCIKVLPNPNLVESESNQSAYEFGDYKVFDFSLWEFYVKHAFKFDYCLCQLTPSKSI